MDTKEINGIMALWGESPLKVKEKRGVYRVTTTRGERCLKEVTGKVDRILFMIDAMDYVKQQGFDRFANCLPALDGNMVVQYNSSSYLVQEWLDGQEPDYRNGYAIARAAETIAMFHRAGRGFFPKPFCKVKNKLGKWPKKLTKKAEQLELYLSMAKSSSHPGEFEKILVKYDNWLINHARESLIKLKDSKYRELVAAAREGGSLVHGDTAVRNFVMINGTVYLIDFDSIAIDIPVTDLWRLLRRTLRREQWDVQLVEKILNSYRRCFPLNRREKEVLLAFLEFPEKPWRIAKEYYEKRLEKGWSEKDLVEKLSDFLNQHQQIDRFLKDFRRSIE